MCRPTDLKLIYFIDNCLKQIIVFIKHDDKMQANERRSIDGQQQKTNYKTLRNANKLFSREYWRCFSAGF